MRTCQFRKTSVNCYKVISRNVYVGHTFMKRFSDATVSDACYSKLYFVRASPMVTRKTLVSNKWFLYYIFNVVVSNSHGIKKSFNFKT